MARIGRAGQSGGPAHRSRLRSRMTFANVVSVLRCSSRSAAPPPRPCSSPART
jgi:hypothetical protein